MRNSTRSLSRSGTFQGGKAPGGLALIQAFANTLDVERGRDELESAESFSAWTVDRGLFVPG